MIASAKKDNVVFLGPAPQEKRDHLVDLFCGCGGSGGGLLDAAAILDRRVSGTFVNHWDKAIEIHEANHPEHRHFEEDLFLLDPTTIFPVGTLCSLLWASPQCFPSGALVTTSTGQKCISKVRRGDLVLTHKGRWRKVVATSSKSGDTIKLKGHGHFGLETTAEHPFYSKRITKRYDGRKNGKRLGALRTLVENPYWPKADDMEGKLWATPIEVESLPLPMGHGMLPDAAFFYMLGRWLGDGSFSKGDLVVCCGRHEVDELRKILCRVKRADGSTVSWREDATETAHAFLIGNAALCRFVKREFGAGAKGKNVASWVYGLPTEWRDALIRGYLGADGHTPSAARHSCVTVSKPLAVGMRILLSRDFAVSLLHSVARETSIDGRIVKGGSDNYTLTWQPDCARETSFKDSLHRFSACKKILSGEKDVTVYNLQVEEDESYVVDGIVVHNCTFFSVARGASCVNEQDRSHAHSVTDWIKHLKPECVMVENVKEFVKWGPTIQKRHAAGPFKGELMWSRNSKPVKLLPAEHNRKRRETEEKWAARMFAADYKPYEVPDKTREGEYFDAWVAEVKAEGYEVDYRIVKSCDFGDPTIRARLYLYCVREDSGKQIVWPAAYAQDPAKQESNPRPMLWRTARQCIDWNIKGTSVFTRDKKLAPNTFRRLAIGLVKYGLREFLVSSAHGSPKASDCDRRIHDVDEPLKTLTAKGDRGVVEPNIIQMKGQSHAQSVDEPLTAITAKVSHYVSQPMIDNIRGTGVVHGDDEPLRSITAGGTHQALAEAFMFAIDQSGGEKKNDGTYPIDEPMRTLVTKANQSCIEMEISEVWGRFLSACDAPDVDVTRATTFLKFLVDELKTRGKVDAKPWIYVYYSSGSEGKSIDEPMPTVRTKAGHALVYPVIELNGQLLKIDLLYRMLTPLELQRAMGFPDDMKWADCTKTEQVRAIGNSVSRGVSRAMGLAWYSQDPNVWDRVKHLYLNEE